MSNIDFHADDYAISLNNSKRIIELVQSGKLDSFSIISNMGCYDECMDMLKENWQSFTRKPKISVHINLIDGFWLSSNSSETINGSWGEYFLKTYIPFSGRKKLKEKLTVELQEQIHRVYEDTRDLRDDEGNPLELRLDSHVHTHMIPIVFDSMIAAVKNLGLIDRVGYIRNSKEPFTMFFTTKGVKGTFPVQNAIKNIILNILGNRVSRKLKALDIPTGILWGLMMSGRMDHDRVEILMPQMKKYSDSKNNDLEILCHPGIVLESEKRPEYGPDDLVAFFSENRDVEYDMIQRS